MNLEARGWGGFLCAAEMLGVTFCVTGSIGDRSIPWGWVSLFLRCTAVEADSRVLLSDPVDIILPLVRERDPSFKACAALEDPERGKYSLYLNLHETFVSGPVCVHNVPSGGFGQFLVVEAQSACLRSVLQKVQRKMRKKSVRGLSYVRCKNTFDLPPIRGSLPRGFSQQPSQRRKLGQSYYHHCQKLLLPPVRAFDSP